ncbi:restriction endonuclease subunit S [Neglectibacter timonensis]|uniref:restriction endonuclease subunit S n=1 Tax=Neglectibacter timonensis TaxID=1776382 RepID=UPI003219F6F1
MVKLKALCDSIVRGPFGSTLKVNFFVEKGPDTVKVYEQKNAIQRSAVLGDSYVTKAKYQELKRFECGPGDFIMSCSGTIGCLYQLPNDAELGIINQALCKFHLNEKMLPEVFLTYMKNSVDQLETKGSGIKNIGAVSYIKNMEIALPPLLDQEQFAVFVRQSDKSKFAVLSCSNLNLSSALASQEQTRLGGD